MSKTQSMRPQKREESDGQGRNRRMEPSASDLQIAALREDVRRSGHLVAYSRRVGGAILLLASVAEGASQVLRHGWTVFTVPQLLAFVIVFGSGTILAAVSIPARRRRRAIRSLAEKLAALTPGQRDDVFSSLQSERGETRRIVSDLARHYGASEVAPAQTPVARGDEPSPS